MKQVGTVVGDSDELDHATTVVYLHRNNGTAIRLLPYSSAEALLEQVTAAPLLDVTGDLASGFAWPVPGAHPRRSHVVTPLPAPVWPHVPHPTAVTVELWWTPDQDDRRLVRSFVVWADDPYNAYLIACCLWSSSATGAGAEAAFLYGPDRRVAYRISDAAWTCSNVPAQTMAQAVATATDRFTTDSLPDARTSAMQEERIDGILTYIGTTAETGERLRNHSDGRDAPMDPRGASALRTAAEEIESGRLTEFRSNAGGHYRVEEPSGNDEASELR